VIAEVAVTAEIIVIIIQIVWVESQQCFQFCEQISFVIFSTAKAQAYLSNGALPLLRLQHRVALDAN
jgi:hypothetical protein